MLYRILFKNPYLYHMGMLPISVPKVKPVYICIHASWVRVQTDMGKDRPKNTHGLPMSNTTDGTTTTTLFDHQWVTTTCWWFLHDGGTLRNHPIYFDHQQVTTTHWWFLHDGSTLCNHPTYFDHQWVMMTWWGSFIFPMTTDHQWVTTTRWWSFLPLPMTMTPPTSQDNSLVVLLPFSTIAMIGLVFV